MAACKKSNVVRGNLYRINLVEMSRRIVRLFFQLVRCETDGSCNGDNLVKINCLTIDINT